jgi:hypothetical protein
MDGYLYIDGWLEDLACSLDVSVCMGGGKAGCTGQGRVHRMISYGRDGRFKGGMLCLYLYFDLIYVAT